MARPVSNRELTIKDIPSDRADWSVIVRFAQSFNGYVEKGDFHLCPEVANHQRECTSLSDLRACLFFEYRRHNHFGYPPDDEKLCQIRQLLDRIRSKVETNDIE